jgi:hypothetical protein
MNLRNNIPNIRLTGKKLCTFFVLCLIGQVTSAQTNYYINNTVGNDAANGTSPATPWKTINKVNAMWNLYVAGDSVLFNKGDVFYGSLSIGGRTGTALDPIVFSAYGTGSMPVIRASQPVTGWTLQSGNIWKAPLTKLSKQVWNGTMFVPYYFRTPSLFINNTGQRLGREPDYNITDGGFRTISSHLADNSRISEAVNLPYTANRFQGAEINIRTNREYFKTETVISHNGTGSPGKNIFVTATNGNASVNTIINQFGYFFQNHINTLNLDGEWCHDTTTSTIYMYSVSNPNFRNIEAPLNPSALVINNCNYVKINNLQFENASDNTIAGQNDDNISISNCYINNSNLYGSYIYLITNSSLVNNTFINCNNSGIRLELCSGMTVTGNTIKNVGMKAGMGDQGTVAYIGLRIITNSSGNNSIIENNLLDSIGYLGVNMGGYGLFVRKNEVKNFCMVKDDGGGIYCATNTYATKVYQNIVHDAPGAPFGAPAASQLKSAGIYTDNGSQNQEVYNNTIYNIGYWGILVNLSGNNIYHDNTIFNCSGNALCLNTYANTLGPGGTPYTALNNNVKKNILFPGTAAQKCAVYTNTLNPADLTSNLGPLDSNYYCQPYTGGSIIQVQGSVTNAYTLAQFKSLYPAYELHGNTAPYLLNPGDNPSAFLRLVVNPGNAVSSVNLGPSSYIDAKGTVYTGLVNIPAWGSLALIRTSAALPVSLLEFNLKEREKNILLHWKTENELNNNYFIIERSENNLHFKSIGQVNAAGTIAASYSFDDNSPFEGINYYRLKQVDQDGRFKYSDIKSAVIKSTARLTINPNPSSTGKISFKLQGIENNTGLSLGVTNSDGQLIKTLYLSKVTNNTQYTIELGSPGFYFVHIALTNGESFSKKVLVVK